MVTSKDGGLSHIVIPPGDINREILENNEKDELEKIKNEAKNLYELVVTENFNVERVYGKSNSVSYSINDRIGPVISPSRRIPFRGGYESSLVIEVTPEKSNLPVKTLNFNGPWAPISAGDRISVKIPKYIKKEFSHIFTDSEDIWSKDKTSTFYLDREFREEESAIELGVINDNGEVLEKYTSIDYDRFTKR